ncbi:MAG: hypothetical protein WC810_23945, partial [Janthinobacterium sp.]
MNKNKRTETRCVYVCWDMVEELDNPVVDVVVISDKNRGLSVVALEDLFRAGRIVLEVGGILKC